jgi:O-methyltransferase involved in polyketide biosynthesis
MQFMQWLVRQAGEQMKTFFDPPALADELRPLGLEVAETLSPAEIEARYFQGRSDGYHAFEHVHFARVVKA